MSVRRRDNRRKTAASAWLGQLMLAVLGVWSVPVHLSAQGLPSGSAMGAVIRETWLPAALGIAALLLVAVGIFLYWRRRSQRETPIPLIIDLEALSAAAVVPAPEPTSLTERPVDLPLLDVPVSPVDHPRPALAAPPSSSNRLPESGHSLLPATTPASGDAGTEAARANRTLNGAKRVTPDDERSAEPEIPAAESIEQPPLPFLTDTPAIVTFSPDIESAQPSADPGEELKSGTGTAVSAELFPLSRMRVLSGAREACSARELGGEGVEGNGVDAPRSPLHAPWEKGLGSEGLRDAAGGIPLHPTADLPSVALPTGTEESLQLLPGTFEVLEGTEHPTPIRFFRTAALEVPEVTLGRAHGPPYRHIHLWAPSVSRMHACMRFEAGRWKILNLSQTNPLRVNGLVLDAPDVGCTLKDGDQIQLGEVVLCYREQRP